MNHSVIGQGQNVSLNDNFDTPHLKNLIKAQNPDSEIFQAQIKVAGKLSVVFSLLPKNIMRSRMDEKHPGFSASYIRWSIDGLAERSSETMQGVAEYMKLQLN
ncbi:MAG: hypothetical protein Q8P91_02900 [bacterium]|nr:hypothetical protein [bacterium]